MDFVLHMPVILTIPSCLTFFEKEYSIYRFLYCLVNAQRECNDARGDQQQMWKEVYRMLRMEGIDDVIEQRLQNDRNEVGGLLIVENSITWNILHGMNLPELW